MSDINDEFIIIDKYFPGLFEITGSEFYLKDKTISEDVLYRSYIGYTEPGDIVKLQGKYLTLMLYLDEDPHGVLELYFDFELSDEACVSLFDLGICIMCWVDGVLHHHDSQEIKRRFVIKNIMKHE